MKILIIMQYHPNLYDFVRVLEMNFGPTLVASHRHAQPPKPIRYARLPAWGSRLAIYKPRALRQLMKAHDVIILKHIHSPLNILPVIMCFLLKKKCLIMTQHSPAAQSIWRRICFNGMGWFVSLVNPAILATTLRQRIPLRTRCVTYLPMCIDVRRFTRRFQWDATPTLQIIMVAKAQRRKNIQLLIQAVSQIHSLNKKPVVHLTIVGVTANRPGRASEYGRLNRLIEKLQLKDSVTFIDYLPYEQMQALYSHFDLLVLPAVSEPLGYSVLEAMAAGLPVICSKDAGSASYIIDKQNGYIVEPNSQHALVEAIRLFLFSNGGKNVEKLRQFGQASHTIAATIHTPRQTSIKLNHVFAQLGFTHSS
jgi:glycosyltransferase involved in cell wall biosynthesis